MKERAFAFGPDGILVGILTEPDEPLPGAPAVLLSNAGLNHRIGPFRAWVELARRLAGHGYTTLRFDRNGIGDSDPRSGVGGTANDRAILDYLDAMKFIETKRQIKEFLVIGLCSGVDSIHPLARDDDRIVGAAFIDGYSYTTRRFHARRAIRFAEPARWRRFIDMRKLPDRTALNNRPEMFERVYPLNPDWAGDVEGMVQRGRRLLFVYTGGFDLYFNHRNQFFDMLMGVDVQGKPVEIDYYAEADHTFSVMEHRKWLEQRLALWVIGKKPDQPLGGTTRENVRQFFRI